MREHTSHRKLYFALDEAHLFYKFALNEHNGKTSTSNPFLCAADFFLQLGSCKEAGQNFYRQTTVEFFKYELR